MKQPYEHLFLVCTGARCNNLDRGEDRGEIIRAMLKDENKKLGRKATVRVCTVSCLDLCDHGPNMVVDPEGEVYSHLDRESAMRVYRGIMGDAAAADEKKLSREEFEEGRKNKKPKKE